MRIELTENEFAALTLLKSTGVPTLEAAQLACAAIKAVRGKVNRALRCIAAGAETLKQQERTVTYEKAVAAALEARRERLVTIHKPLLRILRRYQGSPPEKKICPPNWLHHWREPRPYFSFCILRSEICILNVCHSLRAAGLGRPQHHTVFL